LFVEKKVRRFFMCNEMIVVVTVCFHRDLLSRRRFPKRVLKKKKTNTNRSRRGKTDPRVSVKSIADGKRTSPFPPADTADFAGRATWKFRTAEMKNYGKPFRSSAESKIITFSHDFALQKYCVPTGRKNKRIRQRRREKHPNDSERVRNEFTLKAPSPYTFICSNENLSAAVTRCSD